MSQQDPQKQPTDAGPVDQPVVRPVPEREEDAISRSKRILAMVDTYCERPDSMNRTALRVALMGEFEDARAQGRDDFGSGAGARHDQRAEMDGRMGRLMDWWQKVADKVPPTTDADWVLCAWSSHAGTQPPHYEVLLHWPDGAWTGTNCDILCAEEMPEWWASIKPPNARVQPLP